MNTACACVLMLVSLSSPVFVSQDSLWGMSQVSQSVLHQQQQRFETVTSGKKKKKQKMVRADPSLLGEWWENVVFLKLDMICIEIT